jgi:hypothetical protein
MALRRNHDDVDFARRLDQPEMDAQPVGEEQRLARREVGRDVLRVHRWLPHVRQADHDDIRAAHGLGGGQDFEALFLRDRPRLAAGVQADDDVRPAVLEVQRVGVALRTEADDGESFV